MKSQTITQSSHRLAAEHVYQDMRALFLNVDKNDDSNDQGDTIWPQGNAFDTVLDYMLLTGKRDQELLTYVCDYFEKQKSGRYDDWCWPAASSAKAFDPDYEPVFTEPTSNNALLKRFQNVAIRNSGIVINGTQDPNDTTTRYGAQNVWKAITKDPKWKSVKPRFQGGSWQSDINQGSNPTILGTDGEAGFQLSVMNGLMLKLTGLLSKIDESRYPEHKTIIQQAKQAWVDEYYFIRQWIGAYPQGPISPDNLLFKFDSPDQSPNNFKSGGLIRERVSTYAYHGDLYPQVLHYTPKRIWTGDQGLMIAGMGQGDNDTEFRSDLMTGIVNGVKMNFYHESNGKFLIGSRSIEQTWTGLGCQQCYATGGGGIFLREFLSALKAGNSGLIDQLKNESNGWQRMVKNLADTATNHNLQDNISVFAIGLFPPMTRLAALNLAIYCQEKLGLKLSN